MPEAVNGLLRAADGTVWSGLESGDLIRLRGDKTTVFRKSDGLAGGTIRSIYQDRSGTIWIASRFGITRIHDGKSEIVHGVAGIVPPMPTAFADTGTGVVIATPQELWLYQSGKLRSLKFDTARFGKLTSVYCDRSGHLWIGAYRYLLAYDLRTEKAEIQTGIPGPILTILEDRHGNLWTAKAELTPREMDVLSLIARGCSNREIGTRLEIAEKTVRIHVSNVLDKLGVADRTQAAIAAIQRGIVHFPATD